MHNDPMASGRQESPPGQGKDRAFTLWEGRCRRYFVYIVEEA